LNKLFDDELERHREQYKPLETILKGAKKISVYSTK